MENQVFTLSGSYHDKSTQGIYKALGIFNNSQSYAFQGLCGNGSRQ